MFKKSKEKNNAYVNLEYSRNEDNHEPQNKELVQLVRDITGGFVLPLIDGHEYVVLVRGTKTLVFNIVGERIYLNGSMLGNDFAYADNKNNPVSIEVVKLISKLM